MYTAEKARSLYNIYLSQSFLILKFLSHGFPIDMMDLSGILQISSRDQSRHEDLILHLY